MALVVCFSKPTLRSILDFIHTCCQSMWHNKETLFSISGNTCTVLRETFPYFPKVHRNPCNAILSCLNREYDSVCKPFIYLFAQIFLISNFLAAWSESVLFEIPAWLKAHRNCICSLCLRLNVVAWFSVVASELPSFVLFCSNRYFAGCYHIFMRWI